MSYVDLHFSQTTISIELENQIFEEPANNYSQKYKKYIQCQEQICFPEKIKSSIKIFQGTEGKRRLKVY